MADWQWLAPYWDLLWGEEFQSMARLIAAGFTATFSFLTFYLKLRDRSVNAPAKLAISKLSWDATSGFPIYPLPHSSKYVPFPFVSSDLSTRKSAKSGWLTATELRIWNAGKGIVFGPLVKQTSVAQICVSNKVGEYEICWSFSNDPELKFYLNRMSRDVSAVEQRIQIAFDFLHAGKGILISIWHNSADGEGINIKAFSEKTPVPVKGMTHVFRPPVVKFMSRLTDLFLLPSAIVTIFLFYFGDIWQGVFAAIFTWMIIFTSYSQRNIILSPEDLSVRDAR